VAGAGGLGRARRGGGGWELLASGLWGDDGVGDVSPGDEEAIAGSAADYALVGVRWGWAGRSRE